MNSTVQPSLLHRASTLMKPTASHLAKQHKPQQSDGMRFQKSWADKSQYGSGNPCMIEVHAAKRQKLEGGHLRKVGVVKQQINFVHKEAKKDRASDLNMQRKLNITIAREPNLETAHRAHRMRLKTRKEVGNLTSALPRVKAPPLNQKMLEPPSSLLSKKSTSRSAQFQEFHSRTAERASQQASATSASTIPWNNSDKVPHKLRTSTTADCGKKETRRPNLVEISKQEGLDLSHNSKAFPLNKKNSTNKVALGVFLNIKRPTNVPMEFDFQTNKRSHHSPPTELFDKLSLASGPQPSTGSHLQPPQFIALPRKGSKENRWSYFLEE